MEQAKCGDEWIGVGFKLELSHINLMTSNSCIARRRWQTLKGVGIHFNRIDFKSKRIEPYIGSQRFIRPCLGLPCPIGPCSRTDEYDQFHFTYHRLLPIPEQSNTIRVGQNTPVLAIVNLGESHHYNHHLKQNEPNFGKRWFELDIAYQFLRLLALTGLAEIRSNRSPQDR